MEAVLTGEKPIRGSLILLQEVFGRLGGDLAVRLWEGTLWKTSCAPPRWTIVLNHPGALRRMFRSPGALSLRNAYIAGHFDLEGEIEEFFLLGDYLQEIRWSLWERLRFKRHLFSLPASLPEGMQGPKSPASSLSGKRTLRKTQEIPADFFRLILDENLHGSCAYFTQQDDTLEAAQERKVDYLCRKLRLKSGDRLLDVGCGWGGLLIHAARRYGVQAHGITRSRAQAEAISARIQEAGLGENCRVEVCDYRNLERPGAYDKIIGVGLSEHLAEAQLPAFFGQIWRLLSPGGVFLNHGVALNSHHPPSGVTALAIGEMIPENGLLSISDTLRIAELTGFEIRDVENLREHYTRTLRLWKKRLEDHRGEIAEISDEPTYRSWHFHLAGMAHAFRTGRLNLSQSLMVKPDFGESGLPPTRGDWYP